MSTHRKLVLLRGGEWAGSIVKDLLGQLGLGDAFQGWGYVRDGGVREYVRRVESAPHPPAISATIDDGHG